MLLDAAGCLNDRSTTVITSRPPISPGEVLKEEFLDPLGINTYRLCKDTGLRATQVGEIIRGKRAITDETDALLCRYLGLSRGFWRRMQVGYDSRRKDRDLQRLEARVIPFKELLQQECQASERAGC
ncbi:addiction module antidote protein, HigA family [Synechococcus lacustris str. Tous]|uniref:Addiction module antidote protein, HigA family n=2 Tax=Synechococcus TaxID=1129 RepID=A0A2P7EAM8_9SYNE|nr:addiction module antidote protein, HigA family [Synechococcus lacustris str. Tous]